MAYGAMFPQNYQQPYQQAYQPQYYGNMQNAPQMPQNAPAQSNNGITWVQGEAAAKSFPVGAGQSALLMDSEESVFYIKSTDQSGMPQPLRIFDYTERTAQKNEPAIAKNATTDYVSRSEFDEFREDVKRSLKKRKEEEADG
jgi:hypothetical protein